MSEKIREMLAEYAHEVWAKWMTFLFESCGGVRGDGTVIIPKELVERWMRQVETEFEDLPTMEKESDRYEADLILEVFEEAGINVSR